MRPYETLFGIYSVLDCIAADVEGCSTNTSIDTCKKPKVAKALWLHERIQTRALIDKTFVHCWF